MYTYKLAERVDLILYGLTIQNRNKLKFKTFKCKKREILEGYDLELVLFSC
jgi:hypothetical protein